MATESIINKCVINKYMTTITVKLVNTPTETQPYRAKIPLLMVSVKSYVPLNP